MVSVARDSNGRRLYTAEFKRQQVERVEREAISAAELSRELGIARSLVQSRPVRSSPHGATFAAP